MTKLCYKLQSVKTTDLVESTIKDAQRDLSQFFDIKLSAPNVIYINSRKQYDEVVGFKTEPWMVGNATGNIIFILNPQIYTKISTHKDIKSFYEVLRHEYTHIAIKRYCGIEYPRWLNEGLCCYLAKQIKSKPSKIDSLKVVDYFSTDDSMIYSIGTYWVELLISRYGKNKLLNLLKEIHYNSNSQEFSDIFYKIYNIKFTKRELSKLYE